MKRKIIILLISLFSATLSVQAQSDEELSTLVLKHADSMAQCFIAKDYACFLNYSHPKVIHSMGGYQSALKKTKEEFRKFEEEDGITFEALKFGTPSKMIHAGTELQCIIQQQIEMLLPRGRMTAITTLIALSEDNGKSWYFTDASRFDLASMQRLIPSLSNDLVFPYPQDPVFEPFEEEEAP